MNRYSIGFLGCLSLVLAQGCSKTEPPTRSARSTEAKSDPTPEDRRQIATDPAPNKLAKAAPTVAGDKDLSDTATREFPSFPGAVSRAPQWVTGQEPFDVAAFFQTPQDGDNADRIYLDALFEFTSDLAVCFTSFDVEKTEAIRVREKAADRRYEIYSELTDEWEQDPSKVSTAKVESWLVEYDMGFEKLLLAQERPDCVFETGIDILALLPHLSGARQVARVVTWRTRRNLKLRNVTQALRELKLLMRLSRDVRRRSGEFGHLVSLSMDRIACDNVINQILQSADLSAEHCVSLLSGLGESQLAARDRFQHAMQGEFVMARQSLHDLQHRSGPFTEQALRETFGIQDGTPLFAGGFLHCLRLIQDIESFGSSLSVAKYATRDWTGDGQRIAGLPTGWDSHGRLMPESEYALDVDALGRVYAALLDDTGENLIAMCQPKRRQHIVSPLAARRLAVFFEPLPWNDLMHTLIANEARLKGAMCLVALRMWQFEHNTAPTSLAAIFKNAGVTQVPSDPYGDGPLRMQTIDGRPVIYSVGLDGKDDLALSEWDGNRKQPSGDLIFRIHDSK